MATQSSTKKKSSNNKSSNSSQSRSSSTGRKTNSNRSANNGSRGGSGSSAGRSSGNKSGSSRNSGRNGSDKLTNIFLLLLLITIIVLAVLYFQNKSEGSGDGTPTPTGQVQPGGVTPQPEDGKQQNTVTPGAGATQTPVPTTKPTDEAGEPTDVPQETPTPEENGTPTPQVTVPASDHILTAEADEILADVFWEEGYRFTLSDSEFTVDGTVYYRYDAFYGGVAQDYDVLVRKADGELYYYENGSLREFDGVPEHTKEPETDEGTEEMTSDQAAELLRQFPYTSLGLPAALDECSLVLDNWKTVVDGVECSCLNVFYNGTLAGSIYFTEDAAHVYYLDEFGEFVKVR